MHLTGRTRYRALRRFWTRKIVLVLQVEEVEPEHVVQAGYDSYGGGRDVVVPMKYSWRDATVEDLR